MNRLDYSIIKIYTNFIFTINGIFVYVVDLILKIYNVYKNTLFCE